MAYELPDGFPRNLSHSELDQAVTDLLTAIRERYGTEVGSWLPELQLSLVNLVLGEQSRRQLATGSRIAIGSLLVAALALGVAIISLVVSQ